MRDLGAPCMLMRAAAPTRWERHRGAAAALHAVTPRVFCGASLWFANRNPPPTCVSPAPPRVALKACCYRSGSVTACWAEPQIMPLRKPPPFVGAPARCWGVTAGRYLGCRRRLWVHLSAHASCESASDRTRRSAEAQGRRLEAATKTSSRSNVSTASDAPGTCSLLNSEPCWLVVMALWQSWIRQQGTVLGLSTLRPT